MLVSQYNLLATTFFFQILIDFFMFIINLLHQSLHAHCVVCGLGLFEGRASLFCLFCICFHRFVVLPYSALIAFWHNLHTVNFCFLSSFLKYFQTGLFCPISSGLKALKCFVRPTSCYFPNIPTCNQVGIWQAVNGKLKPKLPVLLRKFFGAKKVPEEPNFLVNRTALVFR
jgi:hypothetical protein